MNVNRTFSLNYTDIIIIESLRECDYKTGKILYEDQLYWEYLQNKVIKPQPHFKNIENKAAFYNYTNWIFDNLTQNQGLIVQFEMHGNTEGLHLSSGEIISFEEIQSVLINLNILSKGILVVVSSACYGIYMAQMTAFYERSPFFLIIGPSESISGIELLGALKEFYKQLLNENNFDNALKSLKSLSSKFKYITSYSYFKNGFAFYRSALCNKEQVKKRTKEVLKMVPKSVIKNKGKKHCRKFIENDLGSDQSLMKTFEELKRNFFLLDLYPNLKKIFNMSYQEIKDS